MKNGKLNSAEMHKNAVVAEWTERVNAMPENTTTEKARKRYCLACLENWHDGTAGVLAEMFAVKASSTKKRLAIAGKNDFTFRYNNGARVVNRPAERKTNGGRVDGLLKALKEGRDGFIVYSLDLQNAGTNGARREVAPVIMKYSKFIQILQECNAMKTINRNGQPDGVGIQASSKKLYEALTDYPVPFSPEAVYCDADFEE